MKNHHYDALKNIALLWVPALATFVNTVGMVWGIPYTNEVTATITALGVLIGAGLKVSSNNYTPPVDETSSSPSTMKSMLISRQSLPSLMMATLSQ